MPYFSPPGVVNSSTGYVQGNNRVGCPSACRLSTGCPVQNLNDTGRNNIYPIDNIPNYYCVVNSGPPIPHTTRPDDYTQDFYLVSKPSGGWDSGESVIGTTEDEPYDNPRSDYMYNVFNASTQCVEDHPQSGPPSIPPGAPRPPQGQPFYCTTLQRSLNWFRLRNK